MGGLSIWHILVVVVVVMLLFGKGRLSGTMEDLAHGIKAFKKGMKDEHEHKHDMQPPPALPRTDRPVETLEPIRTTETDKTTLPRE